MRGMRYIIVPRAISFSAFQFVHALVLLSSYVTFGFVLKVSHLSHNCNNRWPVLHSSSLPQQQSTSQQTPPPSIRPVYVDSQLSLLGATAAVFTFEALTGKIQIPQSTTAETFPDIEQPVYLLSDVENGFFQEENQSIIHMSIGLGDSDHSNVLHAPEMMQGVSTVGLYLTADMQQQQQDSTINPDSAQECGLKLDQTLLSLPCPLSWVSLDVSLHAAMLQVNSFPKTPNLPHQNSYYVMLTNGDSVMVEYVYDTERLGGSDPLSCQTKEVLIETSPTPPSTSRSIVQAAAYSALRGNGRDPLGSAAIAASVATILGDSNYAPGPISWATIERMVQMAKHIRQYGIKEAPGMMRQQYIACGYK